MASYTKNMNFGANLLPNTNLEGTLGASTKQWNLYSGKQVTSTYGATPPASGEEGQIFYKIGGGTTENWIVDDSNSYSIVKSGNTTSVLDLKSNGLGAAFFGQAQTDGLLQVNGKLQTTQPIWARDDTKTDEIQVGARQRNSMVYLYAHNTAAGVYSNYGGLISRNANGIYMELSPNVAGHSSAIGTVVSFSRSMTIANSTWSNDTTELDTGTWVIYGKLSYQSNSTGFRRMILGVGNNGEYDDTAFYTPAMNGPKTTICASIVVEIPSSQTSKNVYIRGYQNSGTSLTMAYMLYAVRIA